MTTETIRVTPFYCGTQFMDWQESNCCNCKKYNPDPETGLEIEGECTILDALGIAAIDDGTVSVEIAKRMGYGENAYIWQCGEVDWTEEHKLAVARKHGYSTIEEFLAAGQEVSK